MTQPPYAPPTVADLEREDDEDDHDLRPVTIYCAECGGPSDVADVTTEENHDGQWRVTLLDCGHQEATPR